MVNEPEAFVSLKRAAAHLGVPAAWLKAEAEAQRVPCLPVGRGIRFNINAVRASLLDRAALEATAAHSAARPA